MDNGNASDEVQLPDTIAQTVDEQEVKTSAMSPESARRPCQSFSYSVSADVYIEATVWSKVIQFSGQDEIVYSVTVRRSYKREDGTCGNTNFLCESEIMIAVQVMNLAANWIMSQRTSEGRTPL